MSASSRDDGARMQTFDNDDTPPPMPLSWRPFGSGLPISARNIGSHSARSSRSRAWNITARLVPPRMNTAGREMRGMAHGGIWRRCVSSASPTGMAGVCDVAAAALHWGHATNPSSDRTPKRRTSRSSAMADTAPGGNDVFEIMGTTRSMRRLKADPVPDELIRKILEAGACAANGGNTQKWRFLVIKDPAIKKAVAAWYKKAFDEVVGPRYASSAPPPGVTGDKYLSLIHI